MRAAGWFVVAVASGAEALLVVPMLEPDVVVMDLRVPIDALEAVRRLKAHEDTMHIPIVACTALDHGTGEIEGRVAGCDDFITGPCEPEALRDLLESLTVAVR